jgi:nucleotide-binding universal stress UspA family protein
MNIKKILVPLDGSETSLHSMKYAIDLAKQCDASIIGFHVITDLDSNITAHTMAINDENWPSYVRDFMKENKKLVSKGKIKYEELVIGGRSAGLDILNFAENKKNSIDLIIMGRRGRSFPKEVFLGSTTNFIINKSKVPVLIVR